MTANGSVVKNGDVLTGSQELRIYGINLDSDDVALYFNNVQYTPLFKGDGYFGYILGDNGVVNIVVNGSVLMTFSVSGIVVPDVLPNSFVCKLRKDINTWLYEESVTNSNCINFPHVVTGDYTQFYLQVGSQQLAWQDKDQDNWELSNGTIETLALSGERRTVLVMTVTDPDKVCYLQYKEFIVAVFNYTNN